MRKDAPHGTGAALFPRLLWTHNLISLCITHETNFDRRTSDVAAAGEVSEALESEATREHGRESAGGEGGARERARKGARRDCQHNRSTH